MSGISKFTFFTAMAHKDYRQMWWATIWGGGGRWAFLIVVSWQVFAMSHTSLWVGIVTFTNMGAIFLFAPLGGVLADRLDRKKLAAASMVANATLVIFLLALTVLGIVAPWHIALLAGLIGVSQATFMPAVSALLPNLVPREKLLNAVALRDASLRGTRIIGPALLIPILNTMGPPAGMGLIVALYILAMIQILRIQAPGREPTSGRAKQTLVQDLSAGFIYIYTHRTVAALIVITVFHCGFTMAFDSILPAYSEINLGIGRSAYSNLVLALGLGAMLGSIAVAGSPNQRLKGQLFLWTGLFSGLTMMAFAYSTNLTTALILMAAVGGSQAAFMALSNTFVQSIIPDHVRGRVSGIYAMHMSGIMALLNLGYGEAADIWGSPPVFLATGLLFILCMIALSMGWPTLRQIYQIGPTPIDTR